MKQALVFSFLLLVVSVSFAGGGWPAGKGNSYFKLYGYYVGGDQYFLSDGSVADGSRSSTILSNLYFEYGLTHRLTTLGTVGLLANRSLDFGGTTNSQTGVADSEVGLSYNLVQGGINVSITALAGLPLGASVENPFAVENLGDGEFNQKILLEIGAGYSLGNKPAYVSGYTGFNNRTNGFSDEFKIGLQSGVSLLKQKLLVSIRLDGNFSLKNGTAMPDLAQIWTNDVSYLGFTPEISYSFNENWGMSLALGGAFFAENILAVPSFTAGAFAKF